MALPQDLVIGALPAFPFGPQFAVVIGMQHEIGGCLEPLGDLGGIGRDGDVGWHGGEHGRDLVARMRAIEVAGAYDAHPGGVDAQFLPSLAQRGFLGRFTGIDLAAGEGDLSRVGPHVRRAVEQEHAGLLALGHRDEHGCRTELLDRDRAPVMEQFGRGRAVITGAVKRGQAVVQRGVHAGTSGNTMPWLETLMSGPERAISISCR